MMRDSDNPIAPTTSSHSIPIPRIRSTYLDDELESDVDFAEERENQLKISSHRQGLASSTVSTSPPVSYPETPSPSSFIDAPRSLPISFSRNRRADPNLYADDTLSSSPDDILLNAVRRTRSTLYPSDRRDNVPPLEHNVEPQSYPMSRNMLHSREVPWPHRDGSPRSDGGWSDLHQRMGNHNGGNAQFSYLAPLSPLKSASRGEIGQTDISAREKPSSQQHSSSWWTSLEPNRRPWGEHGKNGATKTDLDSTGKRVMDIASRILGITANVAYEVLSVGAELLSTTHVEELSGAAKALLRIWDDLQAVDMNRAACLRLTDRSATILSAIYTEIIEAGGEVGEEMRNPILRLTEAFAQIETFMKKQNGRPFLIRYFRRDEIRQNIQDCLHQLDQVVWMFHIAISMHIFKVIMQMEKESRIAKPPSATPVVRTLSSSSLSAHGFASGSQDSTTKRVGLQEARQQMQAVTSRQEEDDFFHDYADLRQILHDALRSHSDVEMVKLLQVRRDEIPEALRALRDISAEVQQGHINPIHSPMASRSPLIPTWSHLDQEFVQGSIDVLTRLSDGQPLPPWTISRFEVERGEQIGYGHFSDVYKGAWKGEVVAIKVLARFAPRDLFVKEVKIWRNLQHPLVLKLIGASSTSSDPPWFFVSPYFAEGNLVTYLRRLPSLDLVDPPAMIHDIALGMDYLHRQQILHGDLKGTNVLINDQGRCIIADFGMSRLKSEVYRLSRKSPPDGTLQWQAPEFMAGTSGLTEATDVYSFAICCVEILSKGELPWRHSPSDIILRQLVIVENRRPPIPEVQANWSSPLATLIQSCWDRDESHRPAFQSIVRTLKGLRQFRSMTRDVGISPLDSPERCDYKLQSLRDGLPESSTITDSIRTSYRSHTPSAISHFSVLPTTHDSYPSSPLVYDVHREALYREELRHEFHPSLTLALWHPTHIVPGAVGFLSKERGEFITLFNAFKPTQIPEGAVLRSLETYGDTKMVHLRDVKRDVPRRGMDLLRISPWTTVSAQQSDRSFVLRGGRVEAYLLTKSTKRYFMSSLQPAMTWFMEHINTIVDVYGKQYHISREDLYLVTGTLEAKKHALFVSDNHEDGKLLFIPHPHPQIGQPWGHFAITTDPLSTDTKVSQPSVNKITDGRSKISLVSSLDGYWDTVLVARLRFKAGHVEPTQSW
ncbi:uncharacterized protein FIBRA_06318 [Fibroporia radiculosa]|uniref:Protein kinase domain-containing protein n=1 Tax=Fibroporia radiculosa TaxID=599839 RepID=J4IB72_9APHY|nr:uncharacterized protein FIBRA_06318 [Fibroporia radiculosa]CCM04156.1 predicted protein [Fibroporia radiculosa]